MIRAALLALLLTTSAAAQTFATPAAAALVASLGGRWTGTLTYRDYRSNQQQELPMVSNLFGLPDGATIIAVNSFNDGPKAGIVTITDVSLFDTATNSVTTASFRRGGKVEPESEATQVARYSDPTHWSIVYTQDGKDNDLPAKLRITQTRDGDILTAVKDVQPLTDSASWTMRSQTRLVRDRGADSGTSGK